MEKSDSNKKALSGESSMKTFRCFFKQHSICSSISVPIRIAPAWGRMLRFGNTTKFKTDEFLQVNCVLLMLFYCLFHAKNFFIRNIENVLNI